MKKTTIIFMIAVLFFSTAIFPVALAAESKQASVSIPITTGLTSSAGSAKSFLLDLPSGVSPLAVNVASLKYAGANEVIGSIGIESGKLKVTLKGVSNNQNLSVYGYESGNKRKFITRIGNSIWRYSDGRRWQINDYNTDKNRMETYDKAAQDSSTPSNFVPITKVNAMSNQSTAGRGWYTSSGEKIDEQYVLASTIEVHSTNKSPYVNEVKFPNGKIITTYTIPYINDPEDDDWEDQTASATIPITGHVQGRFYSAFVEYYYKATAKLTTNSYGGKISFDYSLPTEPTLTGSASVLKPNPNPTKFQDKDVAVQLSLKGDLAAYTDTSNISEWVFYAKEKGVESTLQTKKEYSKVLSGTRSFDFVIPKSRINSDNYEQKYDLTVIVRFTKPVVTSGGTLTSLQQSFTSTVEVYKKDSPIPTDPLVNKPTLIAPVAILEIPDTVMAGEEFMADGSRSFDKDGTIVGYEWSTSGAVEPLSGPRGETWYRSDQLGEQRVTLRVVDNDGLTNSTSGKINVLNPRPSAELQVGGTKKENRKVILSSKSTSPKHYPIDETKTVFSIVAISGGKNSDIKYSGSLTGIDTKDVLFKKAGTYRATLSVTNTAGYSASTSVTFDIVPDEAPSIYLSVPSKIYRDPTQNNKAIASLVDMSFSPDYDFLNRRIWEYRYDSNNNGSFTDEAWVIFSNENKSQLNLQLSEVGKYEIKLTVIEEFDQPTIPEFVTEADRRFADTYTDVIRQPLIERTIEVGNRAPEVDWTW